MPNYIVNPLIAMIFMCCWALIAQDLIKDHEPLFVHLANTLFWFWMYNLFKSEEKI